MSADASIAANTNKLPGSSRLVTKKGVSAFGEAVGISASLVRQSSAKLLFSSADSTLRLLKSPAYSDLGSGNFFK